MNVAILSLLLFCAIIHHCDCSPRKDRDVKIEAKLTSLLRRLTKINNDERLLKKDRGTYEHKPIPTDKNTAVVRQGGDCNPTPDGHQYLGHTSVTVSGKQCQAWASQSPHQHSFNKDDMYPDRSVNDASNYCRNPDSNWNGGLWCYTTDPDTRWERCDVPACGGDCNPSPDGHHYIGHTSVTWSGTQCQAWASQSPHQHPFNQDDMFPDGSVNDASNYCRNPDRVFNELWCYTTDPGREWQKCNVLRCAVPCSASHLFKCPNNDRCIRASYVCDGHNTCGDWSDELNCPCTASDRFKCPNTNRCFLPLYVCDGVDDCGDGSDELNCPSRGCGNPAIQPDVLLTRIVGGVEARKHSWPWQCKLGACGASIIDKYHILTAAHCIFSTENIRVTCGVHDRKDFSEYITEQIFTDATATVHEGYTTCCANDIAIIRLPTPLRFNEYVQPVCLPSSPAAVGTKCVATGWGSTKGTGDNTVLRQVILPIVSHPAYCKSEWSVCAGPMVANKSICSGDSGGPLVCKQGDRWFQYGVNSFVYSCTSGTPSGFANVVYFVPWIKKQTGTGGSTRMKSRQRQKPPVDLYRAEKELLELLQRKFADNEA